MLIKNHADPPTMDNPRALVARMEYYGISPWEAEVAYGYLSPRFNVEQTEVEADGGSGFVSHLALTIPVRFSEEFFKWFEYKRWERLKALFREMKRRRGSGNALRIAVTFKGSPSITFVVDAGEGRYFANAVEKIDFMLELIPYHLAPGRLPAPASRPAGDTTSAITDSITYGFDTKLARWRITGARAGGHSYTPAAAPPAESEPVTWRRADAPSQSDHRSPSPEPPR